MRLVIAFDCDGTLECGGGPVKMQRLGELVALGAFIAIVSSSQNCAQLSFPPFVAGDRLTNLKDVRKASELNETNPPSTVYLYVSDNKDYDFGRQAGFTYVEASNFV